MSDPLTEPPPIPAHREGWLDKESFGFGLVAGALAAGIVSLVAEIVFQATAVTTAAAVIVIAMGLTVWFWRKRPRRR